jgi:adenylosuccinate synthase
MKQKVDILCGCQYGSEGKGLVAGMLVNINRYDWIISVNSAQAGHTVIYKNMPVVTRHLPSGAVIDHNSNILIGAGAVINLEILVNEIKMLESLDIPIINRLYIHQNALLIKDEYIKREKRLKLMNKLGSTCEGVGVANAKRALRSASVIKDNFLSIWNGNSPYLIGDDFKLKGNILLEGSQGFGLSIFSEFYPKCTSRDTTASAFLSYARLSPRCVNDIYGVFRTFPIRVAGNSGYLYSELSWEKLSKRSGYKDLMEITTVTKRPRRVGCWDSNLAKQAMKINGITKPILTFANYLDCTIENQNREYWSSEVNIMVKIMADDIGSEWFAISTSREGGWWYNNNFK